MFHVRNRHQELGKPDLPGFDGVFTQKWSRGQSQKTVQAKTQKEGNCPKLLAPPNCGGEGEGQGLSPIRSSRNHPCALSSSGVRWLLSCAFTGSSIPTQAPVRVRSVSTKGFAFLIEEQSSR